jgi:hypothetical protein
MNDYSIPDLIEILSTAEEDDEIFVEFEGKEYPITYINWVNDKRLVLTISK